MHAIEAYRNWLRGHRGLASALESVVSNAQWLLPARFAASELPAEVANSASGLFGVLNDFLLSNEQATALQLLLSCMHQVCTVLAMHDHGHVH